MSGWQDAEGIEELQQQIAEVIVEKLPVELMRDLGSLATASPGFRSSSIAFLGDTTRQDLKDLGIVFWNVRETFPQQLFVTPLGHAVIHTASSRNPQA